MCEYEDRTGTGAWGLWVSSALDLGAVAARRPCLIEVDLG
jgi:hypothetical protein